MAYSDFTSMPIWQHGLSLLIEVYRVSKQFPVEERYGLTSDMRRAANSIIHNIAEGYGRFENKDKSRFYKISRGSAYELISQLFASHLLGYIIIDEKQRMVDQCKGIIDEADKLILSVETRKQPKSSPQP